MNVENHFVVNNNNNITSIALKSSGTRGQKRNKTKSYTNALYYRPYTNSIDYRAYRNTSDYRPT